MTESESLTESRLVTKNDCISIDFSLKLMDETIVDGTEEGSLEFCLGDGTMIQAFEDVILGMTIGQQKKIQLDPRETFGFPGEENYHWIEKDKFNSVDVGDQSIEEGLMIEFDTPAGDKLPGVVLSIEADRILVDFNHPLAGRELIFSVHLLAFK